MQNTVNGFAPPDSGPHAGPDTGPRTGSDIGDQPAPRREVLAPPTGPGPGVQARTGAAGRLLAIRLLNYLTNHVIAHVPSHTLRRLWYARVMGLELGRGAGINLGAFLWTYGPRGNRREGVRIGRNSRIGHGCTLDLRSGLWIGDNVSVSPEVMILGSSHDINGTGFADVAGFVTIEDHVWIGARAVILPGVTVGRGAVVAAGAVVTRSVAPLTVVGGVPARKVGVRDPDAVGYEIRSPHGLFE